MSPTDELTACTPIPIDKDAFNPAVVMPYGCHIDHIQLAMQEFLDFLAYINVQLYTKSIARLESLLMLANFSSLVGEFMASAIPKYSLGLVRNRYHNGHPDLIPANIFPNDAVQHTEQGIEIKASRHLNGWQGHNPENIWLLVFMFDANRPHDTQPKPFRFVRVAGAALTKDDWNFSGRSATSRRTITASVNRQGYAKMMQNWIYQPNNS